MLDFRDVVSLSAPYPSGLKVSSHSAFHNIAQGPRKTHNFDSQVITFLGVLLLVSRSHLPLKALFMITEGFRGPLPHLQQVVWYGGPSSMPVASKT